MPRKKDRHAQAAGPTGSEATGVYGTPLELLSQGLRHNPRAEKSAVAEVARLLASYHLNDIEWLRIGRALDKGLRCHVLIPTTKIERAARREGQEFGTRWQLTRGVLPWALACFQRLGIRLVRHDIDAQGEYAGRVSDMLGPGDGRALDDIQAIFMLEQLRGAEVRRYVDEHFGVSRSGMQELDARADHFLDAFFETLCGRGPRERTQWVTNAIVLLVDILRPRCDNLRNRCNTAPCAFTVVADVFHVLNMPHDKPRKTRSSHPYREFKRDVYYDKDRRRRKPITRYWTARNIAARYDAAVKRDARCLSRSRA